MSNLDVTFGEFVLWVMTSGVQIAVGVASFRRSRCLSRYPIWKCLIIGALSAWFPLLWLILWAVNRKDIAAQWRQYRESRAVSSFRASV